MFCNVSWSVTWSITWSSNWYVTWCVMMSHDEDGMSWHWWRRFELEDWFVQDNFYQTPPQVTINIGSNQKISFSELITLPLRSIWTGSNYFYWPTYAVVPDISLIFIFANSKIFKKIWNFWLFWRKIWVTTL